MFDNDDREHSRRGPSGAHRYRRCPGSVAMEASLPDTAGIEAAYGDVFHEYAAICLEFGIEPDSMIGGTKDTGECGVLEFTEEMARKMKPGLAFCRALMEGADRVIVEERVDIQPWAGAGEFGTTDCAIVALDAFRIVVFDWKWGGNPVSPIENDQAILYALGVWHTFAHEMFMGHVGGFHEAAGVLDDVEVMIVIEQPRAPGGGGIWTTTIGDILKIGEAIKIDAEKTEQPNAPRIPGPVQCKFCSGAKLNACPEYEDYMLSKLDTSMEALEAEFERGIALEIPQILTPEARSQILIHRQMIVSWLDQLHSDAYDDAENDRPVPGMKLVSGRRSPKKWTDEAKAEVILKSKFGTDAFVTKLRTPTSIEEEVGKERYAKEFEPLVTLGDAKPQLVSDEDDREARASRLERFDTALDDDTDSLI